MIVLEQRMGNEIFLPQQWEDFWQRRQNDLNTLFAYILQKPQRAPVTLDDLYLATSVFQQSIESWFEYHGCHARWDDLAPDLHAIRNLQVHLKQRNQEKRRSFSCDSLLQELKAIRQYARDHELQIHGLRSMIDSLAEIISRYKNDY